MGIEFSTQNLHYVITQNSNLWGKEMLYRSQWDYSIS